MRKREYLKTGRIYFVQYYTRFVEYCFREYVQYPDRKRRLPETWEDFTGKWLEKLNESDRDFITYVFNPAFRYSSEGCANYQAESPSDYQRNRDRLFRMERDFAIESGLCEEVQNIGEY